MGYTIATPIRDEKTKAKMLAFLKANFRQFTELTDKNGPHNYYRGPLPDGLPSDESLSYDSGPCRIGFDFNDGGFAREYIFTVCRWMALKVGRLYSFPTKGTPDLQGDIPIYAYDGDDQDDSNEEGGPTPVLLEGSMDVPEKKSWCVVNKLGVIVHHRNKMVEFMLSMMPDLDGYELIRVEMERLDALWNANN